MYKHCKTERSIQRQKLFQTALLSMMENQTYQEISVTALCKQMQIPRKTFYRYYDSLIDVLNAIMDSALDLGFLCLEGAQDLAGFFTQWEQQKNLLDALEKSGMSYVMVNRIYTRLAESTHKDRPIIDDIRYSAGISAIMTMVFTWHHTGMKQTIEEMSELARSVLNFQDI